MARDDDIPFYIHGETLVLHRFDLLAAPYDVSRGPEMPQQRPWPRCTTNAC
jgi:hypothetical protein